MKVNREYGFFITLTGACFIFLLYIYSSFLIFDKKDDDNKKKILINLGALSSITFFSLSVNFQSKLFAYFAIIQFYYLMGFYTECFGLGYFIGFKDKDSMIRIIIISFCALISFLTLRMLNISNQIIELYRTPIQIFGSLTHFLGLLILSSLFYDITELSYSLRQIMYISSLLIFLLFGNIFNLPSLTNTTLVFTVLYIMEKHVDFFRKINGNIWLMILILSICLWMFSLYLHRHPKIITSFR